MYAVNNALSFMGDSVTNYYEVDQGMSLACSNQKLNDSNHHDTSGIACVVVGNAPEQYADNGCKVRLPPIY